MVAGALVTMGTLGDRIGRRRLLMIGAAAFGAVSVLAAFSTSAEMLIVSRALLGLAGATLAPSTLSLIFHMFADPRERSIAIGIWIGAFSAGSAIGPVLGGVAAGVLLVGLGVPARAAGDGRAADPRARACCPSTGTRTPVGSTCSASAMSIVAMLAVVYGLKQIAQDGVAGAAGASRSSAAWSSACCGCAGSAGWPIR